MIPVGDENPRRSAPVMTSLLIGINVAVYLLEAALSGSRSSA